MRPELERASILLRKTDPESLQEALRLVQGTVFSFSMKVCGHRQDAEDTMQDVLISSLPHLAKIDNPRALAVWLYTVTRNRCRRNRRRSASTPPTTMALEDLMPGDRELAALSADTAPNPEQRALSRENHQLVHRAVLRIPPEYRIVLVLHDMEDLDTEQVAQVLSLQPGAVRVRLHRARLYVRREMSKLLSDEPAKRPPRKRKMAGSRRPVECRELFAGLSDYLDGRMEPKSCDEMRAHIDACPACIAFLRDLKTAIERCRSLDIPADGEVGLALRRLLTAEYLRLLHDGT